MTYTAEIFTSSIVVIGDFNPAIFSPDWLERNKLIGEGDAMVAREGKQGRQLIVSHQVATFESDWFTLQVLENQFSLTSKSVLSPAFKDLAVGIFQLVSHTPVRAVGMNFMGHFKLANQEECHKVGDMFAPKKIWDELYLDEFAGLQQLTIQIQQENRDTVGVKDKKTITLQPSNSVKYGVNLTLNDHHDVSVDSDDELTPADQVAIMLDSQWESAWKDSVRVFDIVLSKSLGE